MSPNTSFRFLNSTIRTAIAEAMREEGAGRWCSAPSSYPAAALYPASKNSEARGMPGESNLAVNVMETSTREFLDYYEKVRGRTLKVIGCIPPEKFDWTCREDKFSFADIIRHLAALERYMYAENVQRRPSRYPGHGRELADGPENVLAFFERMHRESMEIFGRLTETDLQQKCVTPGGASISVWKWLRAMVEHEIHHRAQIYVYLGLLGIPTPPIYGLTSEEVRERSRGQE